MTPEQIAAAVSALLVAGSPLMGPAAPAIAALAPLLTPLIAEIHSAIEAGQDPHEAAKAALARARASDPGPLKPRADAIDAANLARIRAAAQHIENSLADGHLAVTAPIHASLATLIEHGAK